jgi:hypothetical protein
MVVWFGGERCVGGMILDCAGDRAAQQKRGSDAEGQKCLMCEGTSFLRGNR